MRHALSLVLLLTVLSACDSSEPELEPEPIAITPAFNIASQTGTFADGTQGIAFAVTPDMNVSIVRIDVKDPLNNTFLADLQSSNLLAGQSYTLQESGTGYSRVSGTWSFRFQGSVLPGNQPFDVTTSLPVGARVRNDGPQR